MMIKPADYPLKTLPKGQAAYYYHKLCPESSGNQDHKPRLWAINNGDRFVLYCHHCEEKLFVKTNGKSLFNPEIKSASVPLSNFPKDFTLDLPQEALLYLLKYDITLEEITKYKIGYSA